MEKIKNFLAFIAVVAYILGIGCVGFLFYHNEPFFAVINILILAEAFPYAWQQWESMK